MPRRSKKRKLDEVDEWERSAFLPEDVLDEMESMWEVRIDFKTFEPLEQFCLTDHEI